MTLPRVFVRLKTSNTVDDGANYFPIDIIDGYGTIKHTGVISNKKLNELKYERDEGPLFIRLSLPSGTSEIRPLQHEGSDTWNEEVTFDLRKQHSSSARMNLASPRIDANPYHEESSIRATMSAVWFQLWEKPIGTDTWVNVPVDPTKRQVSIESVQFEFGESRNSRALVANVGENIPKVVSLPTTKSKIEFKCSQDSSRGFFPELFVSDYSPNAESIMAFLHDSRLSSLKSLLDTGSELTNELLYRKVQDPIAATAAAYYLLRKRDWENLPKHWLDNLARWNPQIPDARLIRACRKIESGMRIHAAIELAAKTLFRLMHQSIPLFAESAFLIGDLIVLVEKKEEFRHQWFVKQAMNLMRSFSSNGVCFGFSGFSPNLPINDRIYHPDDFFHRISEAKSLAAGLNIPSWESDDGDIFFGYPENTMFLEERSMLPPSPKMF
ncbi:hypothetical protein [Thalassospira xiamenensis]|uniref:hypothetical protein n=1 Tax=Thalassospira xiamenensis TaxID=220697 RepID=UPI001FFE7B1D|nr:hypothetical protein [Thalassospira xiamenensis]MCK2168456.1 hypothetical protein [Thalassospira xiamenensis]